MSAGFKIECREGPGSLHVIPKGELDLATTPALDALLETEQSRHGLLVMIDLRRVTFLDSTGIHCLLSADARARQNGTELVIIRGPRQIERVLEIAGIGPHLPLVDEPPAAHG